MNIDFSNDTIERAKKAYQQTGIMSYALAIGAQAVLDKQLEALKKSGKIYRHVKTGCYYALLDDGLNEADLTNVCVYRSLQDGKIWVRPSNEFFDGRFVLDESIK